MVPLNSASMRAVGEAARSAQGRSGVRMRQSAKREPLDTYLPWPPNCRGKEELPR